MATEAQLVSPDGGEGSLVIRSQSFGASRWPVLVQPFGFRPGAKHDLDERLVLQPLLTRPTAPLVALFVRLAVDVPEFAYVSTYWCY